MPNRMQIWGAILLHRIATYGTYWLQDEYRNFTAASQFCRSLGGSLPSVPSDNTTAFEQWVSFLVTNVVDVWIWMDYVSPVNFNMSHPGTWTDSYGRVSPSWLANFSGSYPGAVGNTTALTMTTFKEKPLWSYDTYYTVIKSVCMCHCPSPQSPLNGFIVGTVYTDVTPTVSFGCDAGYALSSSELTVCMYKGTGVDWSDVPTCLVSCSQIAVPIDPELLVSYADPNRLSGSTVLFSCQNGLLMYGRAFATCYNGTWDISLKDYPICSDILLPLLINGSQILQFLNITDVPNQTSLATQLNSFMPYMLSGLTYAQMLQVGFSQDDIIAYCFFNQIVCSGKSIVPVLDPENGMCYTVNSKQAINSTSINGFNLLLNTLSSDYFSFVTSDGVKVYIHDQNDPIFHGHPGFVLSPGLRYSISLQKVHKEVRIKLNQPYESCVTDSTAVRYYNFNNNTNYLEQACIDSYVQAQIIANCSCNAPTLPSNDTRIPNCGVFQYACVQKLYADMQDSLLEEATKHCPSACSVSYHKRTTTTSSLTQDTVVGNNQRLRNLNEATQLSIYFSYMRTVTWTEVVSYSIVDFLTDLGSSVFLLVGMSITSWMKLVCLVVSWIKWQITKKR